MKKIILAVILVAVVGVGFLLGTHQNDTMGSMNMNQPMSSESESSSDAVSTDSVNISGFNFSPVNITVKKGTKVTWTNQDSVAHNVKENDDKSGPDSGSLSKGESYSFTFNETGTFKYFCSIHPDMKGTVTVTE